MNAICLITFRPKKIWCDFLNLFNKYDIFIIVDDNRFDLCEKKNSYKNINFISVDKEKCELNGFKNVNFITLGRLITGWDKALYYFGIEENKYQFIWFMEDDIFFFNEDTIVNIDNQYINYDLLSNGFGENIDGDKEIWLWRRINIEYPPPYYAGMMCAVRFSNSMMSCITDYAKKHKTLFFLEALFPTIAVKNNLKRISPSQFNNIHFRHDFEKQNINNHNLYHPVKDLNDHISFRA